MMHAFNIIMVHDLVNLVATSGRVTVSNLELNLGYPDAFVGISGEQQLFAKQCSSVISFHTQCRP